MDSRATIYSYCNYQERCHKEVRNKLYDIGCRREEVESLITDLISDDLLNEERYARSFARGKFRVKQWGKNKIVYALRQNKVSDYCIKKGLSEIDSIDYLEALAKLAAKKWHELRAEKTKLVRKVKLQRYLLQKGFENDLIKDVISEIITSDN